MYRILIRNEWLADQLIHAHSDCMFAAVVAGHNPGEVWVDNLENPSSALVWSNGLECFNFMGRANNPSFPASIKILIENEIIPFLKDKDINYFEFSAEESWYPTIYQSIANRELHESYQYVYKSVANRSENYSIHIEPFRALAVNEALFTEIHMGAYKNADFLIKYVEQYWGTINNFLQNGYGYIALTVDNQIASMAISSAKFHSTHTIGVETLQPYKKQGLSSSLVQLLLNTFNENQITAWWDCMESNIASQKTAEKAGLIQTLRYKVNWFYFE
ncbi:GNAT family N-acetyltransferase [Paenibacillus sp. N1-5-1-14]|uniref:GNAT family N-acetyltransferase n=1 Tax=Paenibacillus radicibacter TaxID=2972488 RepID=UPI002158AF15|nr:GNAT family N-acetyltransferase [Paenibacillus radicibacter]MCR8644779.1 GNAT family N-acetyltransferase [Paenibacillus radicibacter]